MTPLPLPLELTLAAMVVTAAGWDVAARRIPNVLVLAGIAAGAGLQIWLRGVAGGLDSLAGFCIGAAFLLPFFLLRGMGAADVKLMAAIGAVAGKGNCVVIFLLTAVIGGILALGLLAWKGGLLRALKNIGYICWDLIRFRLPYVSHPDLTVDSPKALSLPYAVPMALGSLVFLML
ncbi:MAG: prepilin peptidase [Acidobacteria bacterium]|nr:prepilin peptidase [Acidobacteriota bacterium]